MELSLALGTVGGVVFDYDATVAYRIENVLPYSFSGDFNAWIPALGAHSVTATPYSGPDGTGTAGIPASIAFTVVDTSPGAPPAGSAPPLGNEGREGLGDGCPLALVSGTPGFPVWMWVALLAALVLSRRR